MNLRRLKYFVVLAEQKNFTAASEVLYISQPTLSQEIMKMEKEYGFKLFVRTSRQVLLTKEGERLLPEVRNLLKRADDLIQMIESLKQEQRNSNEFVIGLDSGWDQFEYIGITRKIREFRSDYPSVTVRLVPFQYPDSLQQLESGYMNAAVGYCTEALLRELPCAVRIVDQQEMQLAVPVDQLPAEGEPDIAKILSENDILTMAQDKDHMTAINQLYRAYGLHPKIMEVHDMRLMLEYIGAGGGIGLIPASYAETLTSSHIGLIDLEEKAPVGNVVVLWNDKRSRHTPTKDFVNRLCVDPGDE